MVNKSNLTNEEKLKELTYQHAKMIGKTLQEELNKPINDKEVNKMDAQINKGIQLSLEVHRLRNLIEFIDKNETKELPFVNEKQIYKNVYYISLLAHLTHNEKLINWVDELKERIFKDETICD